MVSDCKYNATNIISTHFSRKLKLPTEYTNIHTAKMPNPNVSLQLKDYDDDELEHFSTSEDDDDDFNRLQIYCNQLIDENNLLRDGVNELHKIVDKLMKKVNKMVNK